MSDLSPGSKIKALVRMNTSAENEPGGPCQLVSPSVSSASEHRFMVVTAHWNAMNSPRHDRDPQAKGLKKQWSTSSSSIQRRARALQRPDSPIPECAELEIDPDLPMTRCPRVSVEMYPRYEKTTRVTLNAIIESPTQTEQTPTPIPSLAPTSVPYPPESPSVVLKPPSKWCCFH